MQSKGELIHTHTFTRDLTPSFATTLLKRILPSLNATLITEPTNEHVGLIKFANGRRTFYRDTIFGINPVGSCETAIDKYATAFFLKYFGYNSTECYRFARKAEVQLYNTDSLIDSAYHVAETMGFPVMLKPNTFSEGRLVTKVFCRDDFISVAKKILQVTDTFLVERFYSGNDYRLVIFDGNLVAAYHRQPLSVTGNGSKNIQSLLMERQDIFSASGMGLVIDAYDYRIQLTLRRLGMDLDTVLPLDKKIFLLDNANLSTGGTSHDVTNHVHPDYAKLAASICSDMALRLCGVDIITENIAEPRSDYVIIEINSAPGLRHFASMSTNNTQAVENLYRTILYALEHG